MPSLLVAQATTAVEVSDTTGDAMKNKSWQHQKISNHKSQISDPYSTQSAMKTFVSCPPPLLRLLQKTIFLPSGENIGNASNVLLCVS